MKLLVINPNITESVTRLIEDEARRAAAPGTELTVTGAPFGVAYIETRFEAMIGAYAVAHVAGAQAAGHDAVVVAAFGDPGVPALREVLDMPVVGLTDAALASETQCRPARPEPRAAGTACTALTFNPAVRAVSKQ